MISNRTKIDDLDGKTDELLLGAMDFDRFSKDLKKKYQWERYRIYMALAAIILVLNTL